jgi:hypothetical protein
MKFWNDYKGIIITVIIIIVIVFLIYYFGKQAGKKYVPKDIIIPPDLQHPGDPSTFNPGTYTDAIYQDVSCYLCLHSSTPYNSAMNLSNSQLAALYNDWNQRYAEKFDSKTIIQAITGEYTLFNTQWVQATADLLTRLRSLPGTQG